MAKKISRYSPKFNLNDLINKIAVGIPLLILVLLLPFMVIGVGQKISDRGKASSDVVTATSFPVTLAVGSVINSVTPLTGPARTNILLFGEGLESTSNKLVLVDPQTGADLQEGANKVTQVSGSGYFHTSGLVPSTATVGKEYKMAIVKYTFERNMTTRKMEIKELGRVILPVNFTVTSGSAPANYPLYTLGLIPTSWINDPSKWGPEDPRITVGPNNNLSITANVACTMVKIYPPGSQQPSCQAGFANPGINREFVGQDCSASCTPLSNVDFFVTNNIGSFVPSTVLCGNIKCALVSNFKAGSMIGGGTVYVSTVGADSNTYKSSPIQVFVE